MGLSVCVSVKSHLTYGASVRPENAVTYSAGNEDQKICGVFSETAPLQRSSTPSVVRPCVQSAIFPCVFSCTRMRISRVYTRMIHRRGFSTLVLFITCVFMYVRLIMYAHIITCVCMYVRVIMYAHIITCICMYVRVIMYAHIINPRRACAARVTVVGSVCVCVCVSVKSHLTYGASVRPENAITYSAGNEGQKICGVFSETAPLQRSSTPSVVRPCVQSAIFPCVVYAHAYFSCHTAEGSVTLGAHAQRGLL